MNSVLLIGQNSFTTGVRSQVRGLDSLIVTVASPDDDMSALVSTLTPDVVIIQSSTLVHRSVVKTLGQGHTAYFIVIEDSPSPEQRYPTPQAHPTPHLDRHTAAQMHPPMHQLEEVALALESGADAYLYLTPEKRLTGDRTPANVPPPPPSGHSSRHSSRHRDRPETLQLACSSTDFASESVLFHPSQCRLIQAHIQIGLTRAQRYRDLSRINDWLSAVALVDALTQINNRRAFDIELPNQIKMARNKGTHLSLMVVDIDYFKSVNDRFGHLIGDEVLKQLAKRLLTNMRFYDTPFRYGGEEFVVTLNNTDAQEGIVIANRLRTSIAQTPFKLLQPVNGQRLLDLTVSIGVTELTDDDDINGNTFLNRADQNLLKAKTLGRNRVVGP